MFNQIFWSVEGVIETYKQLCINLDAKNERKMAGFKQDSDIAYIMHTVEQTGNPNNKMGEDLGEPELKKPRYDSDNIPCINSTQREQVQEERLRCVFNQSPNTSIW